LNMIFSRPSIGASKARDSTKAAMYVNTIIATNTNACRNQTQRSINIFIRKSSTIISFKLNFSYSQEFYIIVDLIVGDKHVG
jgi:hypothetical protein